MKHKTFSRSAVSSVRKGMALALLLGAAAVQAAPVTVDYTIFTGNTVWGTGSFSGNDNDSNGLLSLAELISFNGSNNVEGQTVTLAGLSGFGDFNISQNLWLANGTGWGRSGFAFFSWNGTTNSVNNSWATAVTQVSGGNTVPEPGSLALGGIALLGLAGVRLSKRSSAR